MAVQIDVRFSSFYFPISFLLIRRDRRPRHDNLHAPVQLSSRRRIVRRHRFVFAESVCRNRILLHALRHKV